MKIKCDHCQTIYNIKPSRYKRLNRHFCSRACWHKALKKHPIEVDKQKILDLYASGYKIREIAKRYGYHRATMEYHFKKWGVRTRRNVDYDECRKMLQRISRKKSIEAKKNFQENYNKGKISWRSAHKKASQLWGITKSPCQVCGWDKAERDMHLIIPGVLEKSNAVSLCPNCHRLWHRGKINKNHIKPNNQ